MASQITSPTIVYSTVYSGADQRKHHSSASLNIVRGIQQWPMNSPHKWPELGIWFHLMTSSWWKRAVRVLLLSIWYYCMLQINWKLHINVIWKSGVAILVSHNAESASSEIRFSLHRHFVIYVPGPLKNINISLHDFPICWWGVWRKIFVFIVYIM